METGEGMDRALGGPSRARTATRPAETSVNARWWRTSVQAPAAALIAFAAGLGIAIGLSLLATGLAHSHVRHAPPLLLSAAWSAAAAVSFVSSIAYLLVEPKRRLLLVVSAIPAAAMLCSVLLLLLRV